MTTKQAQLEALLDTEISGMGYEFVGCVLMQHGRGTLLRIYVDKPGGVTVEDCTKVTRHVNSLLDVEDPIQGHYTLEVSSPGLERPLFKPMHYQRVIGKKIKLKLHAPREGRRNLTGVLQAADAESITLLVDNIVMELPYHDIDKAHVELEFPELKKVGRQT
jgi:ribosome maturation factor RimP